MKEKELAMYIAKNIKEDNLTFLIGKSLVTMFELKMNNPNGPGRHVKFTNKFMDILCHNGINVKRLKNELTKRNIYIINKNM